MPASNSLQFSMIPDVANVCTHPIVQMFAKVVAAIGYTLDGIAVLVVAVGALLAFVRVALQRPASASVRYRMLREYLGRAIVVGLEFLIAGDIIRSVVVTPTVDGLKVLGLIVLIRTFLSMTLQLEVEGRWPWHRRAEPESTEQAKPL